MSPILHVDDDPNDVFLLQHAMKKAGVANPIQVLTDGQQAIDYLRGAGKFADRETFPLPGLVLLDLKLPHVMGLDVLKWIRQQSGMTLVVVLMTASGEDRDIATAYRLGANGFLVKPSEASKLEDMVKAIKDFWLTYNTPPQKPSSGFPIERTAAIARRLLKPRRSRALQSKSAVATALTSRQTEVVQLIAEGCSTREIACVLSLSSKTVEKHRQAAMDKLDIHDIASLTRYAVSSGVVESKPYTQLAGGRAITRAGGIALNFNGPRRSRTERQFAQ